MVVCVNVTYCCTANPFRWLLGDNTVAPKGFQRLCNVPEPCFFSSLSVRHMFAKMEVIFDVAATEDLPTRVNVKRRCRLLKHVAKHVVQLKQCRATVV